jgi:hypothetical protein
MNDNEKQFEDFVRQIKFDDTPDYSHRDELEKDILAALAKQTRQQEVWRIIMKSKMTKFAAAAVIILIGIFSITLWDRSTTPAWAIEDTAKALDRFNAIYISGVVGIPIGKFGGGEDLVLREDETMTVDMWAQANKKRTKSANIRMETGDGAVGAVYNMTTYMYDPEKKTVQIESGEGIRLNPWPSGDFLLRVHEMDIPDLKVIYGKDGTTGRDHAFLTLSNPCQRQSWWLEIDLETNLPVRAKGWNNTRREGIPSMDMQRIVYFHVLPDEMFEFEIPEGATVIDKRRD